MGKKVEMLAKKFKQSFKGRPPTHLPEFMPNVTTSVCELAECDTPMRRFLSVSSATEMADNVLSTNIDEAREKIA